MVQGWGAGVTKIWAVGVENGRQATGTVNMGAGGCGHEEAAAPGRRPDGRSLERIDRFTKSKRPYFAARVDSRRTTPM